MKEIEFKRVFSLEYIREIYELWCSGEARIGRSNDAEIDITLIQEFLFAHEDAHLMLDEAREHSDPDAPLSATAIDLIFTYLDESRNKEKYH